VEPPARPLRPGTLTTERLTLRPVRPGDAPAIEAMFHDPRVNRFLPARRRTESGIDGVRRDRRVARLGSAVRFAIRTREHPRFIGTVMVFGIDRDSGRAELGYALVRDAWGSGYASEAAGAVIDWAFSALRLHRLDANVADRNLASVRVLRRLGFRAEGVRREAVLDGRRYADLLEFGRTVSDRGPGARSVRGGRPRPVPNPGRARRGAR